MPAVVSRPKSVSWMLVRSLIAFICLCCFVAPLAGSAISVKAAPDAAISLANGSLVRDPSDGKVYLIWANARHWIDSEATLHALGFDGSPIANLTPAAVATIPNGTVLGLRQVAGNLIWPLAPITANPIHLDLGQPAVAPGSTLRLSGSGFVPGEPVTISAPQGVVFSIPSDGSGRFTADVPIVGSVGLGLHHIYAQGARSGLFGVQVFYTIASAPAPSVASGANTVVRGANLSVSGAGFGPGEQVQLFVANGAIAATAQASNTGAFGPIAVPQNLEAGTYSLEAYGAGTHRSQRATFTVVNAAPTPVPPAPTFAPATPVKLLGTPLIAVNPPVVVPGAQTVVSGSGFQPGEVVLIRINGALQGNVSADSFGNFGGVILTIPVGVVPGGYVVAATGATSGATTSVGLTVQAVQPKPSASISLSPSSTLAGGQVTVAGTGFAAGESVIVSLNGAIVQSITTDGSGSFRNGSFFVPANLGAGRYAVSAVGASSGRGTSATLTINPVPAVVVARFFVNPGTVTPGARIAFGGSGFGARETVLIRLDGALLLAVGADLGGGFGGSFLATQRFGSHLVSATGASSGRSASAGYRIVQPVVVGIGLEPNRTHRGSTVLINGNNLLPGEFVLVRFRGSLVGAVQADGAGRISHVRLVVPGNAPYGVSAISITGARSGRSATTQLYIAPAPAAGPRIGVSTRSLHRNAVESVSGSGFQGGETVLIRFRGQLVQAAVAGQNGTFSKATFRIPVNTPYGRGSVSITGARSGRSASTTVDVTRIAGVGISVSPGTLKRGHTAEISGHGFFGSEILLVRVNGSLVQAGQADRNGNFSHLRFTLPKGLHKGTAVVQVVGGRSNRVGTALVQVR